MKGSYDVRHAYKKLQPSNVLTEESVGLGQEFSLLTPKEAKAYQGVSNTMMTSTDTLAKVSSNPHLQVPKGLAGPVRVKTEVGWGSHLDGEQVSIRFASPRNSQLLYSTQQDPRPKSSKQQPTKSKSARSVVHFNVRYEPKLMTSAECRVCCDTDWHKSKEDLQKEQSYVANYDPAFMRPRGLVRASSAGVVKNKLIPKDQVDCNEYFQSVVKSSLCLETCADLEKETSAGFSEKPSSRFARSQVDLGAHQSVLSYDM